MPRHTYDPGGIAAVMAEASAEPGQPDTLFRAVDDLTRETVGHILFTVLANLPKSGEVERMHSSRPREYPLLGRKRMGPTPWGDRVLKDGRTWFGRNADDIRWAFPDHELILSLGCESCLNAPVRYDGRVLGVISVLGPEGAYEEEDLGLLALLTPYLVPPLLSAQTTPRSIS
ncbi:GAF domain-containing protein [Lutibaculum baratangense]|uniref:GAF domain-containing protein n=1 Tax=Lutibaculum baratangense AMV1 TaxID=631454 RepID=V4RKV3_9HYPH|nr:GAF domain-containing protein [Lutibaculum baratangense]ESR25919.1 hypothetical protein N177_1254 [Lutibaculum baratangense AMV1]